MTVPAKHFQTLLRLTTVLVVLDMALIGVAALMYIGFREYKTFVYERCVERVGSDIATNLAREDMGRGFRELGELAGQANLSPEDRRKRAEIYLRMAGNLDKANAAQVSSSCKRLEP